MTTHPPGGRPRLVAHRGTRAPEHTIPAYEAALAEGADMLLLDARLSADGHLVVIRDERLERTTDGRGLVREQTIRQLKRLDAGRWFGRAFRGQRIQTVAEVLERFRHQAGFLVELPAGSDFHPGIEERLLGLLQLYDVLDRTLVASLDHPALRRCRELDPEVRTVARLGARPLAAGSVAPGLVEALCLPASLLTGSDVQAAREAGLGCYARDVEEPAVARRLLPWGVAGLITGRPDLIRPEIDREAAEGHAAVAGA